MFGVNKRNDAAHGLSLGKNLEGEGCFARRLGAVNLDNAATRNAADAKGHVERDGAGGNGLHMEVGPILAIAHDGTLAELLLDLLRGGLDHLFTLFTRGGCVNLARGPAGLCHVNPFSSLATTVYERSFAVNPLRSS